MRFFASPPVETESAHVRDKDLSFETDTQKYVNNQIRLEIINKLTFVHIIK